MNNSIERNSPPPGHHYNSKVDPKEADGEPAVRLFKDVVFFLMAIGIAVLLAIFCYAKLTSNTATAEKSARRPSLQVQLAASSATWAANRDPGA